MSPPRDQHQEPPAPAASPHTSPHVLKLAQDLNALSPQELRQVWQHVDTSGTRRRVIYADEAYRMLGLDRLKYPAMALQRLINNNVLPRRKINGRLVFHPKELERVIEKGGVRRPGRPAKN